MLVAVAGAAGAGSAATTVGLLVGAGSGVALALAVFTEFRVGFVGGLTVGLTANFALLDTAALAVLGSR
jgi:hypothetical protein